MSLSSTTCVRCHRRAKYRGLCAPHFEAEGAHGFVDAAATRNRVALLRARGYTLRELAKATGISFQTLIGPYDKVQLRVAEAVLAVPIPHRIVPTHAWLPAIGTQRRIQALVTLGWPMTQIEQRAGLSRSKASYILRKDMVAARTAAAIAAAFNELQLQLGPSERARIYARKHGWHPPLAWDEHAIDNPDAKPVVATAVVKFPELYAELRDDLGFADREKIAAKLGIKLESLERQLERYREIVA